MAAVAGSILLIIFSMNLPASFTATVMIILALMAELWRHRRKAWALPALVVYMTVLIWYYADFVLYPAKYQGMPPQLIDYAYGEVLIFALTFRAMVPFFGWRLAPRTAVLVPEALKPALLLKVSIAAWVLLFTCAVSRMNWDVLSALFPLNGRGGDLMWARAAASDAGPTGFLVSTGGYLYMINCALFGIVLVLARTPSTKIAAGAMMALTWPFFLLCGTRNQFLAVGMPWVFCYGLIGRQKLAIRLVTLAACFLFVNFTFQIIVAYRDVGYMAFFEENESDVMVEGMEQQDRVSVHEGLNMLQELCYENAFLNSGQLPMTWGWDYFVQATGFVPRAIWPSKPMMGMDYAKARGFGGGNSDIGVVATLSTGVIGQGVLEYGPIFGPVAPALLMALWCGLLGRWWQQRVSLLRMGLFLVALGITFNLGRNITNITLWPVIFAYCLVRLAEKIMVTRPVVPAGVGPAEVIRAMRLVKRPGKISAPHPAVAALSVNPAGNELPLS